MNKPSNRINLVNKYKELNNPNNISYQTFVHRVKSGMTPEEAISKKKSNNTGLIKKYRELENPYNISYSAFCLRIKKGMTPEEAMRGDKSKRTYLIKKYSKLENPYNISYQTFYLRVKNGINPEEAMKIPNKRNIFPRGDLFVKYNSKYLKIEDAEPLFPLEQCKKLYKSGIKLEKLFKNLE